MIGKIACCAAAALFISNAAEAAVVGFWNFDETAGTTAADSSGSGNNATLQSGAAFAPGQGVVNGALDLRSGGFASVPALNFSGLSQFSIQTWVQITPGTTSGMLVAGQHQATIVAGYFIALNDSGDLGGGGGLNAGKAHVYQTYPVTPPSPTTINDGSWHQVVAVFGAANTTVYVDGANAASVGRVNIPATLGQFLIGGILNQAGNSNINSYQGLIDNVAVFNTALGADDVAALYRNDGLLPPSETPVPAALPLFATGLGALGIALYRRRRSEASL